MKLPITKLIFLFFVISCLLTENSFADCPTYHMICPEGDKTSWDTCWKFPSCVPCAHKLKTVHKRCDSGCPDHHSEWVKRADGCSAEQFKPLVDKTFKEACNVHDLCYSTPGVSRAKCDSELGQNMQEICTYESLSGAVPDISCLTMAAVVSATVEYLGQSSYDENQDWAKSNCGSKRISAPKKATLTKHKKMTKQDKEAAKKVLQDPYSILNIKLTEDQKKELMLILKKFSNGRF